MNTFDTKHATIHRSLRSDLGRVALATGLVLLVPLAAMGVTHEVNWSAFDFAVAAVLLLGVSGVSHLCNVPINRRVKAITDPAVIPADWEDPRPLWRRFHYLRTFLAVLALAVNAAAVTAM